MPKKTKEKKKIQIQIECFHDLKKNLIAETYPC